MNLKGKKITVHDMCLRDGMHPKRHQITVAQIAEQLNIAPNKARNTLRKASISKPTQGWTFNTNDPQVTLITKLLQAG